MSAARRALVLVDVQQEYVDGALEIQYPDPASSLRAITHAIDVATAEGIPVVAFQHESAPGAPVFDPTTPAFALHPDVECRRTDAWTSVVKRYSSVFAGTDLQAWLAERDLDTITLVGFMTNNCVLATAADAETRGIAVEVLSDATGAINLANDAGTADAEQVHTLLMTLLNSSFAAVAPTAAWAAAAASGEALPKSDLVTSALAGRAASRA